MSEQSQGVFPMIAYEDGLAAMAWLAKAFGFIELRRFVESDGRLAHGEMETGGGLIMLATPSIHYQGPKNHREHCAAASKWSETPYIVDGVLVMVANLDAHYETARQAGATILSEPEDGPPARRYRVEDLEGHRWMFMQAESS